MPATKKAQSKNGVAPTVETIPVTNPVTGEIIGTIDNHTHETIDAAMQHARHAQRIWGAMSTAERCKHLARFRDLLWKRQREAMDIIRAETGKNDTSAFVEVLGIDSLVTWCVNHAPSILAPESRQPTLPFIQYAKVYHKPHGVAGFISPWNYPFFLAFIDAIPALAAGNAVIIKPSEVTPYSALFGAKLLHEAGIPQDIVQVITGDGTTGAALVDAVDYISFTGSTAVGKRVAAKAAERLIPCSLELGGKDALIVLQDADLDQAATSALMGGLENAGQMCLSIERIYVENSVYEAFIDKIKHYAGQLIIGTGRGFDVSMGSMTSERELERTEQHVQDAIDKGAKLVFGGKRRPDLGTLFYEPAILIDVDHTMDVMNIETFGPVLPIMPVKNETEAVMLANSTEYGLSSAVFTRDLRRGEHLATQLDTGDVGVNRQTTAATAHTLPWGGQKQSGMGRRGGKEGLLRFTHSQSIVVDRPLGSAAKPSIKLLDEPVLSLLKGLRYVRQFIPFI